MCCLHDGVFDFDELRVDLVHEKKGGMQIWEINFRIPTHVKRCISVAYMMAFLILVSCVLISYMKKGGMQIWEINFRIPTHVKRYISVAYLMAFLILVSCVLISYMKKKRDANLRNQLSDTYTRETVYKCCLHDGVFDFGELRVDLVHEKKEGWKIEKSIFGYLTHVKGCIRVAYMMKFLILMSCVLISYMRKKKGCKFDKSTFGYLHTWNGV